ncbi:MAG TPA: hypothetical protein VHM91_13580, partial [Verrucomicrobiales bacterium]|nr:hypothetical protein [Verrucomicrobiales bacterium]
MMLPPSVFDKATTDKHAVSSDVLRALPESLADPIAVFQSRTHGDSLVVLTEHQEDGRPVIVAVHLDRAGPNKLVVNRVASIYAKGWQTVADMFEEAPAYLNQEKSRAWARTARNQFPGVRIPQIRLGPNTATPDHVVKAAAPPASPPSEPNKGEAGGAKPGGGTTSFSLVRPLFASPEVMELRSEKSKWRNPGEGREGFDPAEAEALVSRYYHPQPFASIPKDAVLVPMPSTSGKNILPSRFADRIAKDFGQTVYNDPVGFPSAVTEAKTKTSFWKKAADPVRYRPGDGLEALKKLNKPVVIVEDILNTGESWMAFADLLTEHGIKVVDVAALASADPHLTSAADMRQLAEKIAKGTGKPLAEVLPAVHTYFDGTFRPFFETASRAVANAHEARRLFGFITGAQSEGRGAGPTQQRNARERSRAEEGGGNTERGLSPEGGKTEAEPGGQARDTNSETGEWPGARSFNLTARTDKPASWDGVRPGHAWDSSKRLLPNTGDPRVNLPKLYQRGTWEDKVKRVANWISALPPLTDPWGYRIKVAHPQKGGAFADAVENRASHLIGTKAPGDPETSRTLDAEKLDWLGAVPDTIEHAQVRVVSADRQ